MKSRVRRVITGHTSDGRSVIASDSDAPNVLTRGTMVDFVELWSTSCVPVLIEAEQPEPTESVLRVSPEAGGVRFRINVFEPGHVRSLPPRADGRHPMMHRTRSIDFGIVLEGEIHLILDDSETLLHAHDVVIQRGTDHAWENRGSVPCKIAFILIDGEWSDALRASLPASLELRR